ncbi:MAG: hypothetical protein IJS13_00695 [Paludibacteraceae bacterium]|nr:hypothetical protein [Paludibacteraceae bacterium]
MENMFYSLQEFVSNALAGMSALAVVLIYIAVIVLALLLVYFIRIHIAYRMAKNRHRDPLAWALLSFFVSPLLTWIILLIAGNAD